jgi:hypothetical protein
MVVGAMGAGGSAAASTGAFAAWHLSETTINFRGKNMWFPGFLIHQPNDGFLIHQVLQTSCPQHPPSQQALQLPGQLLGQVLLSWGPSRSQSWRLPRIRRPPCWTIGPRWISPSQISHTETQHFEHGKQQRKYRIGHLKMLLPCSTMLITFILCLPFTRNAAYCYSQHQIPQIGLPIQNITKPYQTTVNPYQIKEFFRVFIKGIPSKKWWTKTHGILHSHSPPLLPSRCPASVSSRVPRMSPGPDGSDKSHDLGRNI